VGTRAGWAGYLVAAVPAVLLTVGVTRLAACLVNAVR
jgi:hypothetical protein